MNILLTNVGRRTYFVEYLNELKNYGYKIKIFVSDRSKEVASYYTNYDKFLLTPKVINNHKKYINKLFELSKKNQIDLIIPLSDFDLAPLSKSKKTFNSINTKILVSNNKVVDTCENKINLNKFLKLHKLPHCKIYKNINEIKSFTLIEKPINGSGSQNFNIINSRDLKFFKNDYIYQDYIEGIEYGLDILNDWKGNFVSYCLKKKIEMRGGETDKAYTLNSKKVLNLSKKISRKLRHIGNLDCDLIIDKNKNIHIIDFNCRFGGGYPFTHSVGLNYLHYIIFSKFSLKLPKLKTLYDEKFISKGIKIYHEN